MTSLMTQVNIPSVICNCCRVFHSARVPAEPREGEQAGAGHGLPEGHAVGRGLPPGGVAQRQAHTGSGSATQYYSTTVIFSQSRIMIFGQTLIFYSNSNFFRICIREY